MIIQNTAAVAENQAAIPHRTFADRKPPQRKRQAASPSVVLNALERKYQETLGAKKTLQEAEYEWQGFNGFEMAEKYYFERLNQLDAKLAALESSIRTFDPGWNRKRLMAPKISRSSPVLPKGTFKPILVQVLRNAGEPLTVNDIANRVAQNLGLLMHRRDQRQRIWAATYNALRSAYEGGWVKCLDRHPAQWFIADLTSH